MSSANNDAEFYGIWEEDDLPQDPIEKQNLEIARLRGLLEKGAQGKVEKFYIVRGDKIFVCHKGQLEMKVRKDANQKVIRDIKVKGARMVAYDKDGLRRVDD